MNSFLGLWPFVKPGGVYVIEDLSFSFVKGFDNTNETAIDMIYKLMVIMNDGHWSGETKIPTNITFSPDLLQTAKSILSINCFFHACVFVKNFS